MVINFTFTFAFDTPVEIKVLKPGTCIIEVNLDTVYLQAGGIITEPRFTQSVNRKGYDIPAFWEIFTNLPENAKVEIYKGSTKSLNVSQQSAPDRTDRSKGAEQVFEVPPAGIENSSDLIKIYGSEMINGYESSVVEILPVLVTDSKLIWTKDLTIKLTWAVDDHSIPQRISDIPSKYISKKLSNSNRKQKIIPSFHFDDEILQVNIHQEGWYQISGEDLIEAGLLLDRIDPENFKLWNQGRQILLAVDGLNDNKFDKNDILIFRAEKPPVPIGADYYNNHYTDVNVYYLSWGNGKGLRYSQEDGYPVLPPNQVDKPISYQYTELIESDDVLVRLGKHHTHKTWDSFDSYFFKPAINGGTTQDFTFHLSHPKNINTKRIQIEALFQGVTDNKHDLTLYFNGYKVASSIWEDQNPYLVINDPQQVLLNNYLTHGENILQVNLDGSDASNRYDQIYLNRFKVTYEKLFTADENKIIFNRTSQISVPTQFELDGFTENELFIFSEYGTQITNFVIKNESSSNSFIAIFQNKPQNEFAKFHAFSRSTLLSPDTLIIRPEVVPLNVSGGSDYVIISQDSLKEALTPLIDHHNAVWVDIDNIYRQYSHGVLSPYAIKEFLKEAWASWNSNLTHVLIAGDNIPSMYIQTVQWGAASSDYWYSLVDGNDLVPEFAIGRLPAASIGELENMVAKTMNYHLGVDQSWKNNVLMIAGYEQTFKDQSESMVNRIVANGVFPSRINIDLYSENTEFFGTTDSVLAHFARGTNYINFLGHGGGAVWGDRSLFTREDVDLVERNKKTPFVTSMTCFTGDVQREEALGRRLMKYENGGVVGWFGSAGVGWIINDFLLLQPIHELMFTSSDLTIGEMINKAKIKFHATNVYYPDIAISQMYQFNLTGDPALRLNFPSEKLSIANPIVAEPGETIVFNEFSNFDSIQVQIFDVDRIPLTRYPVSLNSDNSYSLPENMSKGNYDICIYWKEGNSSFRNNIPLSVSGPSIKIVEVTPESPSILDSISISAQIASINEVESVELYVNGIKHSNMQKSEDGLYSPINKIAPKPVSTIQLMVKMVDVNGAESSSDSYSLKITDIPRFNIDKISAIKEDSVGLVSKIRNYSLGTGKSFIKFENLSNDNWELLGYDTLSFSGVNILEGKIIIPLRSGLNTYRVTLLGENEHIKPDTLISEIETSAFYITPELGTTEDLKEHSVIQFGSLKFEVNPLEVNQTQVLRFGESIIQDNGFQPGLELDTSFNTIQFLTSEKVNVMINLDTTDLSDTYPYVYHPDNGIWLKTHSPVSFSTVSPGALAYFKVNDVQKPFLKATVNGQNFYSDSYINKEPEISLVATDNNGVDPRPESFEFKLNDEVLEMDDLKINSINGHLQIQMQPQLDVTDSVLSMTVKDANGIQSDPLKLKFIVADELKLYDYGNFPNPFKDITRFSYELSEPVDELTMEIFSVDGRRVKKLGVNESLTERDLGAGGYNELIWNGRTESGEFVANGVYFYLMKAKKGKTVITKRGKIAKAR